MSKRKCKKIKEQIVKFEGNNISQERMIEIQSEAYYRALKRIENEKIEAGKEAAEKKKWKWYDTALFLLNVICCPWKINKRFRVGNQIYDSIPVLFVSNTLILVGTLSWLFGITLIGCEIYQIYETGITWVLIHAILLMLFFLLLGGIFILAGKAFEKETDSNKIYAYSASIIALVSCVVSIVTLLKT